MSSSESRRSAKAKAQTSLSTASAWKRAPVKERVMPAERTYVLDQAIRAVRPCGVVSVPGVYGGPVTVDMGSIVQKGLRLCSGQTHVKRYLEPLTKLIQE